MVKKSRLILLIGPSGVGKSTVIEDVSARLTHVHFTSLDSLAKSCARQKGIINEDQGVNCLFGRHGPDKALAIAEEALAQILNADPNQTLVVDVGAGFLRAASLPKWLDIHPTVCLYAEPEEVHRRIINQRKDVRTLEDYTGDEYNTGRRAIYEKAGYFLDTTHNTRQETCERFADLITRIIGSK